MKHHETAYVSDERLLFFARFTFQGVSAMTYAIKYIVRFAGTLTQGPNVGRSYTLENSWGGVEFDTIEQARALRDKYRTLEPSITTYQICSRQYVQTSKRSGKVVEIVVE